MLRREPEVNISHSVDLNRKTIDSDMKTLVEGFELYDWKIKIPQMVHARDRDGLVEVVRLHLYI